MGGWPRALCVLAPATVVLLLLCARDVRAVFVVYQLGICLLLPALVNVAVRGRSWRAHLAALGLTGPGTRRGVVLGLLLALPVAVAVLAVLAAGRERLLPGAEIGAALAGWGADPAAAPAVLLFLAVVNAPAEELFWRGYLADELSGVADRRRALLWPTLGWASYHVVTLAALVREPGPVAVMLAGVVAAGALWAWTRERTGSVWPALIGHTAATWSYVAAAWPSIRG